MTRDEFKRLFDLNESDEALIEAELLNQTGLEWFEIAKDMIAQMNYLLAK